MPLFGKPLAGAGPEDEGQQVSLEMLAGETLLAQTKRYTFSPPHTRVKRCRSPQEARAVEARPDCLWSEVGQHFCDFSWPYQSLLVSVPEFVLTVIHCHGGFCLDALFPQNWREMQQCSEWLAVFWVWDRDFTSFYFEICFIFLSTFPSFLFLVCFFNEHVKWSSFPGGSEVKASASNVGDPGSIPGLGRSPGEGNGSPLQYSCLENPMNGGAWWATVHGVEEMATHSNILAWRIPWTEEPGGL